MRNLKKFLALVLAMVMAFSLMLTASATTTGKDFSDASKIDETFVEAAEVLTGMKVFQGDEEAPTFRPTDKINRAEVAALIYRLATGDTGTDKMDLYTTTHPFTDVNADDWFAGYVGYCWNAGYIKGTTATTFNPYDQVTGYETLAMVLRAMGYDANNEFTGANWIVNVSATATQRGLLVDVNKTHYANTLHQASAREVVASILFQAAQKTRVKYTPAFGYQTGDHTSVAVTDLYDDYSSLGWLNFGLTSTDRGVVIGNQQTGEKNTRLGFGKEIVRITDMSRSVNGVAGGVQFRDVTTVPAHDHDNSSVTEATFSPTPYTWDGVYNAEGSTLMTVESTPAALDQADDTFTISGTNDIFNVETGIDLFGHNVKIWFDGRDSSKNMVTGRPTYAYYDKATKTDVVTVKGDKDSGALTNDTRVSTDLTQTDNEYVNGERCLYDVADAAGFKLASNGAVFSNSFSKLGSSDAANAGFTHDNLVGTGQPSTQAEDIASPVRLYKLISNANLTNKADQLDVVIALNIETSQITESNAVNRVPTIGMPVANIGNEDLADANKGPQTETNFISDEDNDRSGENVKQVPNTAATGTVTGVIAKDALVGNSTSTLGDYEFGVRITGTTPRTVSDAEKIAINNDGNEHAYYLMSKVTPTVTGKVVSYNVAAGTVTLENGTVLNRSKYYNTVVNKKSGTEANNGYGKYRDELTKSTSSTNTELATANWALPQSTDQYGFESYNPTTYEFYMDFEGNYLGAKRTHDSTFLYGTYLDYEQKLSTSTFEYYLTGVDLNGEIKTVPVSKFWGDANRTDDAGEGPDLAEAQATRKEYNITGTDNLGVPYRDTANSSSNMNYIGIGRYVGFTINGATADPFLTADTINETDYFGNMARIGVFRGVQADKATTNGLNERIVIDKATTTLGAIETEVDTAKQGVDPVHHPAVSDGDANSNLYLTEDTTFIVVDGYGTDTVTKTKVYHGLTELLGSNSKVTLKLDDNDKAVESDTKRLKTDTLFAEMTYFTKSPYIYAQTGEVCEKVDTIILPKDAVEFDTTVSSLYYMGDPNYTLISSHEGKPIYQYTLYKDGVAEKVWLTNLPRGTTNNDDVTTDGVVPDSFLVLGEKSSTLEPTTGGEVYTAVFLDNNTATIQDSFGNAATADHTNAANYAVFRGDVRQGWPALGGKEDVWNGTNRTAVALNYSATTRNAQAATFSWSDTSGSVFLRVAEAGVTNLNASNAPSGEIWPGVTDLATLNEAGSINPVTGRPLKVAAQLDPNNPLIVTHIYVCWDQTQAP